VTLIPPELLAGVLAAPADDSPRLVCADYLEEHDACDHAEFIRSGVAMARHTDCPFLMLDRARGWPRPFRCGECEYCWAVVTAVEARP
jgi:uncharacterized protein (TIGR02996 family)